MSQPPVVRLEEPMTVYVLVREDQSEHGFVDASIVGLFRSQDEATVLLKSSIAELASRACACVAILEQSRSGRSPGTSSHIRSGNCLSFGAGSVYQDGSIAQPRARPDRPRRVTVQCSLRDCNGQCVRAHPSATAAARPSTSMFDTALGVAGSKMISSFVTRE